MPIKFSHKIKLNRKITSRDAFLSDFVKGKKVLHGGCVDSGLLEERSTTNMLLHEVLSQSASSIVGVDVDEKGINKMKEMGYADVFHADLETWEYKGVFDVIVLGEIIEHVDSCGLFLNTIKRFSDENTKVIFTTPNAYYYLFWLYTLIGKESIHEDHNYLFSFNSLKFLLAKFGFEVVENIVSWEPVTYLHPEDKGLKRLAKSFASFLINSLRIMRFFFPQYGKGIIVVARVIA